MKVMLGDSRQTSDGRWVKVEVTLDETDFQRILIESFPSEIPALPENVFVRVAFRVLELECNVLVASALVHQGAMDVDTFSALKASAADTKKQILSSLVVH